MTAETTAELEREAEARRAELNRTADSLKDRLSPGQMIDEIAGYLDRSDSSLALRNLKTQVRDNPLALALIGGGLAWLFAGPKARDQVSHQSSAHGAHDASSHSSMGNRAASASHALGSAGHSMSSATRNAASGVGHAASSASDAAGAAWHGATHAVADGASATADAARHYAGTASSGFSDLLEREPLVVGALGVAVGAALGALLPATRIEERQLGPLAAKAREETTAMAKHAAAAAEHAVDSMVHTAQDEGLGANDLAAKAERIAKAGKDAVSDADRGGASLGTSASGRPHGSGTPAR